MLKTISAALLAASVIAAPAFAAEAGKTTTTAPVIKADQAQSKVSTTAAKPDTGVKADAKTSDAKTSDAKTSGAKSGAKPDVKADAKVDTKAKAMNANAAITPDEHKTVRTHRHHHKHLSAKKSLKAQPDIGKPVTIEKRS
ncbi:His-rich protein BRANT [Bradyrhizobium manausense]